MTHPKLSVTALIITSGVSLAALVIGQGLPLVNIAILYYVVSAVAPT